MKAFITGATGFIGSHIADFFYQQGIDVRCGYREKSNLQWLLNKPYELVKYSLNDYQSLKDALTDIDYVIHCGSTISALNPKNFYLINTQGTINLLDAVKEHSEKIKRFIYISSQTVGGPAKSLTQPLTERDKAKPITTYAESKKLAEDAVMDYGKYFPVTVLRPSAVVGPRDYSIFPLFKSVRHRLVILIGLKPKYLNLLHVSDLADATYKAITSSSTIGNLYYVAQEEPVSWNEVMLQIKKELNLKYTLNIKFPHFFVLSAGFVFQLFRKLIGKPHPFNVDKGKDFIQDFWICSSERAKSDFGFNPKFTALEAVKDTLHWYLENKWI